MGKLTALFDFEFNRNKRNYIIIISIFCFLLIAKLIINLNSYNYIMNKIVSKINTKQNLGTFGFNNLITYNEVLLFLIGLGVCLLYSIIIWNKDFVGKNKSIYTLYMLPQSKINMYISKFLNIISLVYMYVIFYILTLFIAYKLMPSMMNGSIRNFGFSTSIIDTFFIVFPFSLDTFIYNYVIVLINIISIIFMFLLFIRYSKIYKLKDLIYVLLMIIYMAFIFIKVYFLYINTMQINIVMCLLTTIINIFVSYKILKKIDL